MIGSAEGLGGRLLAFAAGATHTDEDPARVLAVGGTPTAVAGFHNPARWEAKPPHGGARCRSLSPSVFNRRLSHLFTPTAQAHASLAQPRERQ